MKCVGLPITGRSFNKYSMLLLPKSVSVWNLHPSGKTQYLHLITSTTEFLICKKN